MSCTNCLHRKVCPDAFTDIAPKCGIHEATEKSDNVHHPKHYETYIEGLETIDVIYAALGPQKFEGYCRGNVIKYLLRAEQKNGVEDLEKAAVYLDWEIQVKKQEARK